jgi:pilus assembly protein Flp/PilA
MRVGSGRRCHAEPADVAAGPDPRHARAGRDPERGATATEYAILVGFIAVVIALAIGFFGESLSTFFQNIASSVASAF